MVADIGRDSDFTVRVTDIDYERGRLTLNAGTAEGVRASTDDRPFQFEISVGNEPLPDHQDGLTADYYTAVVTDVAEHSCTCELRHRWRTVENGEENEAEEPSPEAARHIVDPQTGVVSARAWLPNPKLDANLAIAEDRNYTDFIATLSGSTSPQNRDYASLQRYAAARPALSFVFFEIPHPGYLSRATVIRGIGTVAPPYNWQAVARRQPNARGPIFMPGSAELASIQSARLRGRIPQPIAVRSAPAFSWKQPTDAVKRYEDSKRQDLDRRRRDILSGITRRSNGSTGTRADSTNTSQQQGNGRRDPVKPIGTTGQTGQGTTTPPKPPTRRPSFLDRLRDQVKKAADRAKQQAGGDKSRTPGKKPEKPAKKDDKPDKKTEKK